MSASLIIREDLGPVVILTMNRPDRRNALSRSLLAELGDTLDRLRVHEQTRAVVLTGAGKAFCSGMDLHEAATDLSSDAEQQTVAILQEFGDVLQALHTLPKPTIAAVNGDAFAGGAGLVAACDFAIAAESARIAYPEIHRGLVPAIVMHDLTRQLGDRRARELLLTGAVISAHQAAEWGLVNSVTASEQCLSEAVRLANSLIPCGPLAVAATKKLLDQAAGRPADLRGAAAVSAAIRCSDEAREGIRAFFDKRPASWAQTGFAEDAT
jgi:methylglutaconyl-CoA hydratase